MKDTYWKDFITTIVKEVTYQMENVNYSIIPNSQVPTGATILPEVWQIKPKRDIRMRYINKWKAHLNIDGSRMKNGIHYDHIYGLVASWNSIRLLLTLSSVQKWNILQLDCVLEFLQAPVKKELYMKIPKML